MGRRSWQRKVSPWKKAACPPWAAAIWATNFNPVPWAGPPSSSWYSGGAGASGVVFSTQSRHALPVCRAPRRMTAPGGLCRTQLMSRLLRARRRRNSSASRLGRGWSGRSSAREKIRGGLAQEGGQVQLGFPKGLHLAVQTHGEVQVVDQVPDGLALPADDGGLVPAGRGQGGVGLQLSRIAHDHTQGGTDVVGDAVNPVRPGFVPGLLVLPEPAAQQKGGQGQHADQGEKEQEHPRQAAGGGFAPRGRW